MLLVKFLLTSNFANQTSLINVFDCRKYLNHLPLHLELVNKYMFQYASDRFLKSLSHTENFIAVHRPKRHKNKQETLNVNRPSKWHLNYMFQYFISPDLLVLHVLHSSYSFSVYKRTQLLCPLPYLSTFPKGQTDRKKGKGDRRLLKNDGRGLQALRFSLEGGRGSKRFHKMSWGYEQHWNGLCMPCLSSSLYNLSRAFAWIVLVRVSLPRKSHNCCTCLSR